MPNNFKYNANGEEAAFFKNKWAISPVTKGGGPSSSTNFYNGIDLDTGEYALYNNGKVFHASDSDELILKLQQLSGQNFHDTTFSPNFSYAVAWVNTQSHLLIVSSDLENIVLEGLEYYIDPDNLSCIAGPTNNSIRNLAKYTGTSAPQSTYISNAGFGYSITSSVSGVRYFNYDGSNTYANTGVTIAAADSSSLQTFCSWSYGTSTDNHFFGSDAYTTGQFHLILNWTGVVNVITGGMQLRFGASYYGGVPSRWSGADDDTNLWSGTVNSGWNYACVVKTDENTYDVYLNGTKIISDASKAATYSSNLSLGQWWSGQNKSQKVGMLYTYGRALTADEISQNYNAQKGRFGL